MTPSHPHPPVRVECWHRVDDPATLDRIAEVRGRLERLAADGRIDGLEVRPWPRRVPIDPEAESADPVLDRIRAFEQWAERTGRSLDPGLERRELRSTIEGERSELVVLPVVCVAVLSDGEVVEVAPSRDGARQTTVRDCLDRLDGDRRIHPTRASP